ncbi:MAG: hypothetical protein RL591_1017, partial [Planctomycetota bacterium]
VHQRDDVIANFAIASIVIATN